MSYAGRSPTSFITRRSASRTDHLLQRRATIVAVEAAEELHQLDDQLGARVDRRRFEQHLLRRRVDRRDLRAPVHQRRDRPSVVAGKSVSVRLEFVGRTLITKKNKITETKTSTNK